MHDVIRPALLTLCLCLAAWADEPAPQPEPAKPKPTKPQPAQPQPAKPQPSKPQPAQPQPAKPQPAKPQPAKPKPAKPQPAKPKPQAEARRAGIERTLKQSVVHFTFKRAPLEDILSALSRATKVEVRLGRAAARALRKRKLKIRYVADRTGVQVLEDLCKASALDFLISDEGVLVDVPKTIGRLRKQLDLDPRSWRLSAEDVAKLLETKQLSLSAHEQKLSTFLRFLGKETGLRFVRLTPRPAKGEQGQQPPPDPELTFQTTSAPLGEVLDQALHPAGYDWLRAGSVILVGTRAEVAAQKQPLPKRRPKN